MRNAARARCAALATMIVLSTATNAADPQRHPSPDDVLTRLASALDAGGTKLARLLAPSRLRIELRLPGGRQIGDRQQRYGSDQAAVLLREFLGAVQTRPFEPQADRTEPLPGRRLWIERPAIDPDPQARRRPHGILHLSIRTEEHREFEHQRLFVGLRETARGWKVEEILHLP